MFFPVARLRAAALASLLFIPIAYAKQDSFFTSSVTYCEAPDTLLIQQFDLAYFAKNDSVFFNISAASVEANVNVTANLVLNVYGMIPLNVSIDLCDVLDGVLCPLPIYTFTGSDTITLPSSIDIASNLPGIAYKIPDLEAYAQLTLREVGTGTVKACVQATLSNGWSIHQPAVEWATGGLALGALLSAIWQSVRPEAIAPYRFLDLMYLYQAIATTGFLSLNYPVVYRAYALNFAWAMGLISTSSSSALQSSINKMRALTGGNMANASSSSAEALVNRKLSPFNSLLSSSSSIYETQSLFTSTELVELSNMTLSTVARPATLESLKQLSVAGEVQTVTSSSSNVLQAGLPIYLNTMFISTANAFMTVFICALAIIAIAIVIFGSIYLAIFLMGKYGWGNEDRRAKLRAGYASFVKAWSLRLILIGFTPIIIFTFYQWTLHDSWLSVLLSVVLLLSIAAYMLYSVFLTLRLALRSTPLALYTESDHINSQGPLYAQYRTPRYYFFLPLLIASFFKAIFIAFVKANGEAQVILILIIEIAVLLSHLILRPFKTRGGDVFATFLAIIRVVCTGLLIAFVQKIGVAAIPRTAIGLVIAVIFSVTVVIVFINLIFHLGLERLVPTKGIKSRTLTVDSSDATYVLEKAEKGDKDSAKDSETAVEVDERPLSPTPQHSRMSLGFHMNHNGHPTETELPTPPNPTSDITTESRLRESSTTTTTSLGSLVPSRWSNSPPITSYLSSTSQGTTSPRHSGTPSHTPPPPSDNSRHHI